MKVQLKRATIVTRWLMNYKNSSYQDLQWLDHLDVTDNFRQIYQQRTGYKNKANIVTKQRTHSQSNTTTNYCAVNSWHIQQLWTLGISTLLTVTISATCVVVNSLHTVNTDCELMTHTVVVNSGYSNMSGFAKHKLEWSCENSSVTHRHVRTKIIQLQ